MATLSRRQQQQQRRNRAIKKLPVVSPITLQDFILSEEGKSKDRLVNVMKTQIGNIILSSDTEDSSGEESKLQETIRYYYTI